MLFIRKKNAYENYDCRNRGRARRRISVERVRAEKKRKRRRDLLLSRKYRGVVSRQVADGGLQRCRRAFYHYFFFIYIYSYIRGSFSANEFAQVRWAGRVEELQVNVFLFFPRPYLPPPVRMPKSRTKATQ